MKRQGFAAVLGAVLALAASGCASKPKVPAAAAGTDYLRSWAGQQRIFRFQGDRDRVTVRRKDPVQLAGTCDVAVEIRSAQVETGVPRLVLEPIGTPGTGKARPRCRPGPGLITLTGYERDGAGVVTGRLDQLLPTPDLYLRAYGTTFDLPAGAEPAVAASTPHHENSTDEERRLERRVTAWPKRVFWVDPTLRDPVVRYEGEAEFEAVVGADGRVYRPQVKGGLEKRHIDAIKRVLPMWRFEPARAGKDPIPAYATSRLILRIR
jgi:hypothetical protein